MMRLKREDLRLYAVTDRRWLGEKTLKEAVKEALKGGATFIQLREKNMDSDEILKEAFEIKELCGMYGAPFVINDDVDMALACDADGVHVGQKDMEASEARKRLGSGKIIGVSVRTVEQAAAAEAAGADYLGVGAVFSTGSKADAERITKETLRDICSAVDIPVIAIGGVNSENVKGLAGTGVCGAAVISAIFGADDIKKAAGELAAGIDEMLKK